MNSILIQTILTLKRLKIRNNSIESILNKSHITSLDFEQVRSAYNSFCDSNLHDSKQGISESFEKAWDLSNEIIKISDKNNVKILTKYDEGYPLLLKKISNPPLLLHAKGNVKILNTNCIAIVGTREPTDYGKRIALKTGETLAKEGYTIVSGLAKGTDSAAHEGSLNANGFTIAVLAHGLQTIYPAINRDLALRIIDNNGVLISEHPWFTPLEPWELIKRDRIQSGISIGIFVVETGMKGGTMHTVNFCKEQKRFMIVLKHPERYANIENIRGNQELIQKNTNNKFFMPFNEEGGITPIVEAVNNYKHYLFSADTTNPIKIEQISTNLLDSKLQQFISENEKEDLSKFTTQGVLLPEDHSKDKSFKITPHPKINKTKKTRRLKTSDQKDLI